MGGRRLESSVGVWRQRLLTNRERYRLVAGLVGSSLAAVLTHWLYFFFVFGIKNIATDGWKSTLQSVGHSLFGFALLGLPIAVLAGGLSCALFYPLLRRLHLLRAEVVI